MIDYQRNTSTNKAYIRAIREYDSNALGGSMTPDTVGHLEGWHHPTHAWYAVSFNGFQNITGGRDWLKLYVNGNGYWQDSNF